MYSCEGHPRAASPITQRTRPPRRLCLCPETRPHPHNTRSLLPRTPRVDTEHAHTPTGTHGTNGDNSARLHAHTNRRAAQTRALWTRHGLLPPRRDQALLVRKRHRGTPRTFHKSQGLRTPSYALPNSKARQPCSARELSLRTKHHRPAQLWTRGCAEERSPRTRDVRSPEKGGDPQKRERVEDAAWDAGEGSGARAESGQAAGRIRGLGDVTGPATPRCTERSAPPCLLHPQLRAGASRDPTHRASACVRAEPDACRSRSRSPATLRAGEGAAPVQAPVGRRGTAAAPTL